MARNPILIEDAYEDGIYHKVEPSFFAAPISGCAKGVYLILCSLGGHAPHEISELLSMCKEPEEDIREALTELDAYGIDVPSLVRA